MIQKRVAYTVTFINDEIAIAEAFEGLLTSERTNANAKLKEMIKAEVEKGDAK